jgi:hypothetical protein
MILRSGVQIQLPLAPPENFKIKTIFFRPKVVAPPTTPQKFLTFSIPGNSIDILRWWWSEGYAPFGRKLFSRPTFGRTLCCPEWGFETLTLRWLVEWFTSVPSGPNVVNILMSVIYECWHKFGSLFLESITSLVQCLRVGTYPIGLPFRFSTLGQASGLTDKNKTKEQTL